MNSWRRPELSGDGYTLRREWVAFVSHLGYIWVWRATLMKTATVRARLQPDLKEQAEGILARVGLTTTEAITLFYRQVVLHRGLPFAVRVPNRTTRRTLLR